MKGKLALILCGGQSDTELFEIRDKIVDALNAVKTAINHVNFNYF
jgi:chaperonin GroEL (HSP60 family)